MIHSLTDATAIIKASIKKIKLSQPDLNYRVHYDHHGYGGIEIKLSITGNEHYDVIEEQIKQLIDLLKSKYQTEDRFPRFHFSIRIK